MDKLKFALLSIVVLFLMGLLGYWSVATLQTGTEYQASQELKKLRAENSDLKVELADLQDEVNTLQSSAKESPVDVAPAPVPTKTPSSQPSNVYKNQSLINDLQKLVDGNVLMKLNSAGTRVGTVQKFLNLYNNTTNKVDNGYGAATEKAVAAFQKDQGLTADGQAGRGTFSKMIDWLKKQG